MRPSFTSIVLLLSTLSAATASPASSKKAVSKAVETNPDDPTGKILYITEPACGYYRCTVTWNIGEQVAVNWLGPPGGNVVVSLQSNIGGPTYPITNSIAGTSQEGYCDAGYGLGVVAPGHECGRVEFVVPSGWQKMDNYTIVVQSLDNPNEIGYTDMITIASPNSSDSNKNIPSGTTVSLVTIPAPTTTNYGASQTPDVSVPAPTAVTGQTSAPSAASASSASSALASSRNSSMSSSAQRGGGTTSSMGSPSAASAGIPSSSSPASSSAAPSSGAASTLALQAGSSIFLVALAAVCCL